MLFRQNKRARFCRAKACQRKSTCRRIRNSPISARFWLSFRRFRDVFHNRFHALLFHAFPLTQPRRVSPLRLPFQHNLRSLFAIAARPPVVRRFSPRSAGGAQARLLRAARVVARSRARVPAEQWADAHMPAAASRFVPLAVSTLAQLFVGELPAPAHRTTSAPQ